MNTGEVNMKKNILFLLWAVCLSGCVTNKNSACKIEAEDMRYTIYEVEEKACYSGGEGLIIQKDPNAFKTGTADYTFNGEDGVYTIEVGYVDEAEPLAPLDKRFANYAVEILRDGTALETDAWIANQQLGDHTVSEKTLTVRQISGVHLKSGDVIRIKGTATGGKHAEHARLDYMVLRSEQ